MSRPLRIEYPGAWYHVMNRGAGRRQVFKTNTQRRYFLSLLGDCWERYDAEWHAYCLMGNHYHLLVRTPQGNLQRIMRHLNGVYTQFFNRQQGRDGALFRGRYKAILVEADAYWLQLSRYLHRNPLEARLVTNLADYAWSSYRAYLDLEAVPPWLTRDYVLAAIGRRRAGYAAYVAGDTEEELAAFYRGSRISPILGGSTFKTTVLAGRKPSIDVPELKTQRIVPSLAEIVQAVCRQFAVEERELWRTTRGRGAKLPARPLAMYLCQQLGGLTLREIADAFGLASYASAGATVRTVRKRLQEDEALAMRLNCILLDLTP